MNNNVCTVTNITRKGEILAVKKLGEEIGYGNLMDIASALWAVNLDKQINTDDGAFIPVIITDVKLSQRKYYNQRKVNVKKEVLNILSQI